MLLSACAVVVSIVWATGPRRELLLLLVLALRNARPSRSMLPITSGAAIRNGVRGVGYGRTALFLRGVLTLGILICFF